jgi:hypothetical protein
LERPEGWFGIRRETGVGELFLASLGFPIPPVFSFLRAAIFIYNTMALHFVRLLVVEILSASLASISKEEEKEQIMSCQKKLALALTNQLNYDVCHCDSINNK